MGIRTLWLGVVGAALVAPLALASAGPMDEKDLQEMAVLIAHGEITEVVCAGEPEFDGVKTYTPYQATLTIDEVQKGDAVDSVTLPFSTLVYEPDASLPKCDWAPYYEAGYKGLFYLMTGASTDLYTLVGDGAYVPDADSVGQGLPSCEVTVVDPDAGPSEDVGESDASAAEDVDEPGPEPDTGDPAAEEVSEPDSGAADDATSRAPDPGPDAFDRFDNECIDGSDCEVCHDCSNGVCLPSPHCPDCFSDNDCAEGEECVENSNGDAFCEEPCTSDEDCDPGDVCVINAWDKGYCERGGTGTERGADDATSATDDPDDGSGTGSSSATDGAPSADDGPSATDGSGAGSGSGSGRAPDGEDGGCAGGGRHAPLSMLSLLALAVAMRRRRVVA